jgi:hypothetical protein
LTRVISYQKYRYLNQKNLYYFSGKRASSIDSNIGRIDEIHGALAAALARKNACIIHAKVEKENNVLPMIPAGGDYGDMLLERPVGLVEKLKENT